MFWLWVVVVATVIVSVPFFRFFIKRIVLLLKLKTYCKKHKYRLLGNRFCWFLRNRVGREYDFTIETEKEILAVKLFGMFRKNTKLIVKENGEYLIRKYYAFLSSKNHPSMGILFTDSKPRPFDTFDFGIEKNLKPKRKILLIHPTCIEVLNIPQHGKSIIVDNGDSLYGMEIYSLKSFLLKGI